MKKPIVFMFAGQGSHYYQMGRKLYEQNPTFKQLLQTADSLHKEITGLSILDHLYNDRNKMIDPFRRTLLTHPSIFMVEYALASVILKLGIIPDYVLGASLGEFAAATISGILTFEEALRAVIFQAQMLESYCPPGSMTAILHPYNLYDDLQLIKEKSECAAVNFPSHFVISGTPDHLKTIATFLQEQQLNYQELAVSHGFHSTLIDGAATHILSLFGSIRLKPSQIPFISCTYGGLFTPLSPHHFWDAIRLPIQFQKTIDSMENKNNFTYLDVGPSGSLATFVKYNLKKTSYSEVRALLTPFGSTIPLS